MADITNLTDPSAEAAAEHEHPPESGRKTLKADIRHGWRLIARYVKADPLIGAGLVLVQIASGGATSWIFLQLQVVLASITNALAAKDAAVLNGLLAKGLTIGLTMGVIGLGTAFAQLLLRIRIRQTLTDRLVGEWMTGNRYYLLERKGGIDHPEQRIQEDVYQFIDRLMATGPTVLFSIFGIFIYTAQLWKMSPPIVPTVLGFTQPLPGLLVYVAFAFAIVWTILTHMVGRSLTRVEVVRQRLEAQFRQEMAEVRENAESIAFARGNDIEEQRLYGTFGLIRQNWRHYIRANLKITLVSGVPSTFMFLAPALICAPFVMKGQMQVGDVALVGTSFNSVYMGLGVVVTQYAELAIWRSSVARLRLIEEALQQDFRSDIVVREVARGGIAVHNLTIDYPDGTAMTRIGDLSIQPGRRLLVQGRSGAGKSTFLRSIAGLWPFGKGEVELPDAARIAFLPQRGYMPNSTLAGLMSYPLPDDAHQDETYRELLDTLGLSRLGDRLHDYQPWGRILSPGEQQRIAAARVLLANPEYLFVDEATSALDAQSEETVYRLFTERLPNTALVSVAHRPSVSAFHDEVLTLDDGQATMTVRRS